MEITSHAIAHGISTTYRYARICRSYEAKARKEDPDITGRWQRADAARLDQLRALAFAGNQVCGTDSHWIEIRHSADPDLK